MSKKTGRLIKLNLNNTASIVKTFVDKNGTDRHDRIPLKYKEKRFDTTRKLLNEPFPAEDAFDE